jgi:hypothetical protein
MMRFYSASLALMSLRTLTLCAAAIVFALTSVTAMHAQAAVEYGAIVSNSAGTAATIKPPTPNLRLPDNISSAGSPAPLNPTANPGGTTADTAKANLQFFQDHSGPDAAALSLHTVPDHVQVWIDDKFVGSSPLDLKLGPGHHRVFASGPDKLESVREFDLAAKQKQSIDLPLKSGYQDQITIQGSSR